MLTFFLATFLRINSVKAGQGFEKCLKKLNFNYDSLLAFPFNNNE